MNIILNNNQINSCEKYNFFITPENISISLKNNNPITDNILHNLQSTLKPSLY